MEWQHACLKHSTGQTHAHTSSPAASSRLPIRTRDYLASLETKTHNKLSIWRCRQNKHLIAIQRKGGQMAVFSRWTRAHKAYKHGEWRTYMSICRDSLSLSPVPVLVLNRNRTIITIRWCTRERQRHIWIVFSRSLMQSGASHSTGKCEKLSVFPVYNQAFPITSRCLHNKLASPTHC